MANLRPKTTTSKQTDSSRHSWQASPGFTLLEILIVLTIISIVLALAMPAISRVTYQRVNSTTRKFVGMTRTIRNDSILLNNIYRLVFDFDNKTYWVESQKQFKLIGEEDSEYERKKKKNAKKGEAPASNFTIAQKYSKEPIKWPGGVSIDGVMKDGIGVINKGLAYIHFFPNGFNEQAIIYINKEGEKTGGYSLWLHSNLGKIDVVRAKLNGFELKTR